MQATRRTTPLSPRNLLIAVASTIAILDQVTKVIVESTMTEGSSIPVIEGVLHWTFVRNPGAAFSLFTRVPWLFTILATAISIWIISQIPKLTARINGLAFGLVLGGAIGNLIDRVVRPPSIFQGHVVDFIDLRVWPTFNVADMGVTIGAGFLILASWKEDRANKAAQEEASRD